MIEDTDDGVTILLHENIAPLHMQITLYSDGGVLFCQDTDGDEEICLELPVAELAGTIQAQWRAVSAWEEFRMKRRVSNE